MRIRRAIALVTWQFPCMTRHASLVGGSFVVLTRLLRYALRSDRAWHSHGRLVTDILFVSKAGGMNVSTHALSGEELMGVSSWRGSGRLLKTVSSRSFKLSSRRS
jgi:hypothetical protein